MPFLRCRTFQTYSVWLIGGVRTYVAVPAAIVANSVHVPAAPVFSQNSVCAVLSPLVQLAVYPTSVMLVVLGALGGADGPCAVVVATALAMKKSAPIFQSGAQTWRSKSHAHTTHGYVALRPALDWLGCTPNRISRRSG